MEKNAKLISKIHQWFTTALLIVISLGYGELRVTRTKFEYSNAQINLMESEIDRLNRLLDQATSDIEKTNAQLGIFPEPRAKIPPEILSSIKYNTIRYFPAEQRTKAYKYIVTIAQIESDFDPNAVGTSGEIGMFQIMPYHFSKIDLKRGFNLDVNAGYAIKILKSLNVLENPHSIWRYNGSPEYNERFWNSYKALWG